MHEYAGGRKMKEKILNLLIFDRTKKERKMLLKLFWLVFSIIAIFVVIFHLKGSFAFLIFYGTLESFKGNFTEHIKEIHICKTSSRPTSIKYIPNRSK